MSPESGSVEVKVPIEAPAEFSEKLLALRETAVGDSFASVTEIVKSLLFVLPPLSVEVIVIAYADFVSKSDETELFNLKLFPTTSKELASVQEIA